MKRPPAYYNWRCMKNRCLYNYNDSYEYYGGKGISFDPKWSSFAGFWEDMGPSYKKGLTLDRLDNSIGYTKSNCRWVTAKQQARNRSSNKLLSFNKKTHTMSEWAEILGMNRQTLHMRLSAGWTIERALSTPLRGSSG